MNNYDTYTIDEIRKEISRFKNDSNVQKLNSYYQSKSLAEILGVSRKELPHSRFLAWLLNPSESHGLDTFSVKKFLDAIVLLSPHNVSKPNKMLFDSIITDDLTMGPVSVETEKSIVKIGRVDIFIEIEILHNDEIEKLQIVIENKVTASETNDQTNRYFDHFENVKDAKTVVLYIYLTPLSTIDLLELTEPQCSCKQFIQVNYQSVVDLIIEPALRTDTTSKTKLLLTEYLQSLSQPSFEEDEEHKEGLIMAIGNEERELLTKFWDKNQRLILASLYAISSDPSQDKDVRDSIAGALDQISDTSKDHSLIDITLNGYTEVSRIKKADIGLKTVEVLQKNGMIDQDIFNFLRDDKSCSFNLLKTIDEVTETEQKYRKYRVEGTAEFVYLGKEYYVARNWGIGNIGKFIDKMEQKFRNLSYTRDV